MKKLRVLEITEFSSGICGVWTRVLSESKEFLKLGHSVEEVMVFSSNIEKGTGKSVKCEDKIGGIKIYRFPAKADLMDKIASKNVTYFNFEEEFKQFKPNIVITHLIHPHSFKALKLCKQYNIPCYLVTHAPFNVRRGILLNLATNIYYAVKVRLSINQFTKIIAVTKWEIPYLLRLGVKKDKIVYIPNGLPEEFFRQKKLKSAKGKDVLFLGRIAPIKNLETLIKAAKLSPDINFSIVGSAEKDYLEKIKKMIGNFKNIKVYPPIHNLKEKIKLIDQHKIFVLPSWREAMPQSLLEAMSRGKIAISSKTDGGKELIKDKENGFLFEIGNYLELSRLIKYNIKGNKKIQQNAIKSSARFSWKNLIKKYVEILK